MTPQDNFLSTPKVNGEINLQFPSGFPKIKKFFGGFAPAGPGLKALSP
jgi:hypothetical protein